MDKVSCSRTQHLVHAGVEPANLLAHDLESDVSPLHHSPPLTTATTAAQRPTYHCYNCSTAPTYHCSTALHYHCSTALHLTLLPLQHSAKLTTAAQCSTYHCSTALHYHYSTALHLHSLILTDGFCHSDRTL